MMVETILESSQDFGMSNGALPQWKRELLQRRAARSRPCAPAAPPPPPPPPPPTDEDEELRYGPGIVKRLKSRYLSLALRDAPRRRPSVLRRAASLEHLLDERPPPAPRAPRAPRPLSMAAPPPAPALRRDSVKRARSVDALSRLESRDEPAPPSPSPPPAPRAPAPRAARPPRRPAPLLRDAERPPPDVVRSTLRKFESAPARRQPPAARVSAVLRGLEAARRSVTPERAEGPRSPSSPPPLPASPPPPSPAPGALPADVVPEPDPVVPVASPLASAVSPDPSTAPPRFPVSPQNSPVAPAPLPIWATSTTAAAPPASISVSIQETDPPPAPAPPPTVSVRPQSPPAPAPRPPAAPAPDPRPDRDMDIERDGTPEAAPTRSQEDAPDGAGDETDEASERRVSRAALEGIARAGCSVRYAFEAARPAAHLPPLAATNPVLAARAGRRVGVIRPLPPRADSPPPPAERPAAATRCGTPPPGAGQVNGHSTPEPGAVARLGAGGVERAWAGAALARVEAAPDARPAWLRAAPRARADAPHCTSVVFNFSGRKEVPDYIENDGIVLRGSRRPLFKAGESGVVCLGGAGAAGAASDEEEEEAPPSPCRVRFVNDNVLINGRSSLAARADRLRPAKLKLQFDDSLTRTFEYPSETSLCEDAPAAPAAPALPDNTHIASAALSRYTPVKSSAAPPPPLGVRPAAGAPPALGAPPAPCTPPAGAAPEEEAARACSADAAKSWSEARALATDLLF